MGTYDHDYGKERMGISMRALKGRQVFFTTEVADSEVAIDPTEHSDYRWVTMDEIGELPLVHHAASLIESLRKVPEEALA